MADKNKAILERLYPIVDKHLSSTSNQKAMLTNIGQFIDKNMEYLSTSGPCYRITISDKVKTEFYESLGLDEAKIKETIKSSGYIGNSWAIMTNPFYTACAVAIRYFIMKNKPDNVKILSFYLCVGMYPLIHHKYFKYNCNENIMNYTISHLSNKYKYKQLQSLYNVLQELSTVCTKTHESRLKLGTDQDFTKYINDMHARLNDNLKNVAVEYYKNHETGNYLNIDEDDNSEDNFRESDNSSYIIDRVVNDVSTKVALHGANLRVVSLSAKICDVSVNELRNTANILTNEDNLQDFKKMMEFMLQLYLFDMQMSRESIKSKDYLVTILDIYKRTNNTDANLNGIRKMLDEWMVISGATKRITRKASISSFKKAMYVFTALTIQDNL